MTIDRREGLEEISRDYCNGLEDFNKKYLEKIQNIPIENITEVENNNNSSDITDMKLFQNKQQKRLVFELVLELKVFLHSLSDKFKTDKRILVAPVFRITDDNHSLHINAFSSMYHFLSMVSLSQF